MRVTYAAHLTFVDFINLTIFVEEDINYDTLHYEISSIIMLLRLSYVQIFS
jgi:hypothetical protein